MSILVIGSKIDFLSSGEGVSDVLAYPDNSMKLISSVLLTSGPYVDIGDDDTIGAGTHYTSYTIRDKITPVYKIVTSRVMLDIEKAKEQDDKFFELAVGKDEYVLMEYIDGVQTLYHDTKLTRLRKKSLEGTCKTLVIAAISLSFAFIREFVSKFVTIDIVNIPTATSYQGGQLLRKCGIENGMVYILTIISTSA